MKQHITASQLNILSDSQFGYLCDLSGIPDGMTVSERAFNIGKMIEILGDKIVYIDFPVRHVVFNYVVRLGEKETQYKDADIRVTSSFVSNNLCDALWDAVKSMLSE